MVKMWSPLLTLSLVLVWVWVEAEGPTHSKALKAYSEEIKGDTTHYHFRSGAGMCQYGVDGRDNPPVSQNVKYPVAISVRRHLKSVLCGACFGVHVTWYTTKEGKTPAKGNFTVFMDNGCGGSCKKGRIDIGNDESGVSEVISRAVQCPVGDGKIDFVIMGNRHYCKISPRNFRIAVHKLEIDVKKNDQGFIEMKHTTDGCYAITSKKLKGTVEGDLTLRLTAVNGAQITQDISDYDFEDRAKGKKGSFYAGTEQFPEDPDLPTAL